MDGRRYCGYCGLVHGAAKDASCYLYSKIREQIMYQLMSQAEFPSDKSLVLVKDMTRDDLLQLVRFDDMQSTFYCTKCGTRLVPDGRHAFALADWYDDAAVCRMYQSVRQMIDAGYMPLGVIDAVYQPWLRDQVPVVVSEAVCKGMALTHPQRRVLGLAAEQLVWCEQTRWGTEGGQLLRGETRDDASLEADLYRINTLDYHDQWTGWITMFAGLFPPRVGAWWMEPTVWVRRAEVRALLLLPLERVTAETLAVLTNPAWERAYTKTVRRLVSMKNSGNPGIQFSWELFNHTKCRRWFWILVGWACRAPGGVPRLDEWQQFFRMVTVEDLGVWEHNATAFMVLQRMIEEQGLVDGLENWRIVQTLE